MIKRQLKYALLSLSIEYKGVNYKESTFCTDVHSASTEIGSIALSTQSDKGEIVNWISQPD